MRLPLLAALFTLTLPALASAETPVEPVPLALTYVMFEAAVPHVDMAVCPMSLAAPDRFCRLTVAADQIHVFAFSDTGDSPMVAFESWSGDLFAGLLD